MPKKSKKKTIKIRRKLISKPAVKSYKDYAANGLIRVLDRDKDKFPEFALYPRARNKAKVEKALRNAGLKEDAKGKWVLRTDKFNIFVYT
jgi:hypothetical protein